MTGFTDKKALRRHYRQVRDAIPAGQRDQRAEAIAKRLLRSGPVQQASSVFVYISTATEVGTHGLIDALIAQGKRVMVPRITSDDGQMHAVATRTLKGLTPNRFGIPEPADDEPSDATPDVTLVPGLAFTQAGERLGQGGGYYDRYLQRHPDTYKVGLCFSEQLTESLPIEVHDVLMDEIVVV